ncbi:MAG: glyoxalase [Verrucomicrobia bacterium]|nr:glyoxalase [Verrucomicrobiota bacterium]
MPIKVKELAFVFHPVTDVSRARKFYEGFLGLKAGMQIEFAPGQWWIEYDVAGQAIALSNAMPGSTSSALTLEIADLESAVAAARAEGITIATDVMEFPPCRIFYVKDPDGNQIGLHQKKAHPDDKESEFPKT